jgi:hypothetical protein
MKLTAQQKDLFNLSTALCMEKYNFANVQNVYDRKNAIKRKLEAAGTTIEKTLKKADADEDEIGVSMLSQKAKRAVNGAEHKPAVNGTETPKKAAAKKAAVKRTAKTIEAEIDPLFYTIEDNPPPPKIGATEAKNLMLQKVKDLFAKTKFGGALIIPTANRVIVTKHLKNEFPTIQFKPEVIPDNERATRIYKQKELKP